MKKPWEYQKSRETYVPVKLTGRVKKVRGGPARRKGSVDIYYEVQGWIFKRWVSRILIKWADPETTTYHQYKLSEEEELK